MSRPSHKHNTDFIDNLHSYDVDPTTNTIYLMGQSDYIIGVGADEAVEPGVEFAMANRFIRNMNFLANRSQDPIIIHMKTCGGDFREGMAIYDTIKNCPNKVIVINYTHARSMSSLIFQAADLRIMMPHSEFMFHKGTVEMGGTCTQFETEAEQNKLATEQMLDIYVNSMRESPEFDKWTDARMKNWLIKKMQEKEDVYLGPKDAIKYGFADLIVGENGLNQYNTLKYLDQFVE